MSGWRRPASWDPFREFQREVGRLFAHGTWAVPRGVPPVNLYEVDAGNQFVVTTPLPGMKPGEVGLSITGETLTISGVRKRTDGVPEESYRRQERVFGRWTRTITLPDRIESDAIVATFVDGVLTVTIPKAAQLRPRQINVTTAATQSGPAQD